MPVCAGIPGPHPCDVGILSPCVPGSPVPVAVCVPVPIAVGFPTPCLLPVGVSRSPSPLRQDPWSPACVCRCPHPHGSRVPCPPPVHAWVPALCFCSVGVPDPSPACAGPLSPFPCHWDPQSLPSLVPVPIPLGSQCSSCPCWAPVMSGSSVPCLHVPAFPVPVPVALGSPFPAPTVSLAPRACRESAQGDVVKGPAPNPPSLSPRCPHCRSGCRLG